MKLIDADELMKKVLGLNNTCKNGNAQWGEYYTKIFKKWIEEARVVSSKSQKCECGKKATHHLCEKCEDDLASMDGGG